MRRPASSTSPKGRWAEFGTVSSHAATVVALLVLSAAEIRRRWFTFLMVAATLLICYSRIYLAKHFPSTCCWERP